MKNPFKQEDNSAFITALVIGAITTGTLAYLYLTEHGKNTREAIKHKVKDEAKNVASGVISKKTGISKKTVKKVADHVVK